MKLTFKLVDSCPQMSGRGAFSLGPDWTVPWPSPETTSGDATAPPLPTLLRLRSVVEGRMPAAPWRRSSPGQTSLGRSGRREWRGRWKVGFWSEPGGALALRVWGGGRVRMEDLALPLGMSVAAVIGQVYIYSSNLCYIFNFFLIWINASFLTTCKFKIYNV